MSKNNKSNKINKIKITLVKSLICCRKNHIDCIKGLGFRRRQQTIEVLDTSANRGMINKIKYLLKIWE